MMSILFNNINPENYNAHLTDFNSGSCNFSNDYLSSDVTLQFYSYKTKLNLRTITAEFEFFSVDEQTAVLNVSNFTATLRKGADIEFPDGFLYHTILKSCGKPKRITDNIYVVSFTFIGFRHKQKKSVLLSFTGESSKNITVLGNYESDCKITISSTQNITAEIKSDLFDNTLSVTANSTGATIIDGYSGKVTDNNGNNVFNKCDFVSFPKLTAGSNTISVSGTCNINIEYYPMFF